MDDIAERSGEAHSRLELATVFGGSGFLGRRIVKHLLDHGSAVRAAMRHSARTRYQQGHGGSFSAVRADILDHGQVAAAVSGASTVINAVSLYQEHGDVTFERVHVEAASRLAAAAREAGAARYIQISGIGSNSRSASSYIRARGKGEEAVTAAFPNAIIVRSAVMTGSGLRISIHPSHPVCDLESSAVDAKKGPPCVCFHAAQFSADFSCGNEPVLIKDRSGAFDD